MKQEKILTLIKEVKPATIVAATKYINAVTARKLYQCGINNFGENRIDSLLSKQEALKDLPIIWHFIGHLQRNKAKQVLNRISYLHSLDSLKLAALIEKYRKEPLMVLVELKLTASPTKNGVTLEELPSFLESLSSYPKVKLCGFMAMSDVDMSDQEKRALFKCARRLKEKYKLDLLSMGMSDDYKLALLEGANFVRLGRLLFEEEDLLEEKEQ